MKLGIIFFLTLVVSHTVLAATPNEDVDAYIKMLQSERPLHAQIADDCQWKGLSDTRLFDLIEQKLLNHITQNLEETKTTQVDRTRVVSYIRELGYSGQAKYLPTLQKLVDDNAYGKVAAAAIINLPKYEKWDAIIANRANFDPQRTDDVNRVANMLRADDVELNEQGAKRIFLNLNQNAFLVELLAQKLSAKFMVAQDANPDVVHALVAMVLALHSAGDQKYYELLLKISNSKTHTDISREAFKLLQRDTVRNALPPTNL